MLDVHPPHAPAHTWRDFFIHIATIVVGLLIAVGLEQLVERIHQHYELRETREAISREFESNRDRLRGDERGWLMTMAELKNNLLVLQAVRRHPGTPQTGLPGDLQWQQSAFRFDHAVWDVAEKNGVTRLMPLAEANHNKAFYDLLSVMGEQSLHEWDAINDADRFELLDPDPTHLSPERLDKVIELTEIALEKDIEFGYSYGRLAYEFPDMPHAVTWKGIESLRPSAIDLDPKGLAAAHALTNDRIRSAAPSR